MLNRLNIETFTINLLKAAKINYYDSEFYRSRTDPKVTWKLINELLLNNKSKTINISEILIDNNKCKEPGKISNEFCSYFTDIGPKLAENISKSKNNYMFYLNKTLKIPNSIYLHPCDRNGFEKNCCLFKG